MTDHEFEMAWVAGRDYGISLGGRVEERLRGEIEALRQALVALSAPLSRVPARNAP